MLYRVFIFHLCRREVDIIRRKAAVLSGVTAWEYTAAPMATLVFVITLVLTGQPLTPVNVFMLICFNLLLRRSICMNLAYGLMETYEAYVSLGRIEEFLHLENLSSICLDETANRRNKKGNVLTLKRNILTDQQGNSRNIPVTSMIEHLNKPTTLRVMRLTKKHIKRENEFILQDIEFSAESGSLTVITGPVGSGKSTLLSAIAGEIPDTSGTIGCQGTLVYVPQIAWIFSGTIRENILFGEPFDEAKYTRIIKACALIQDVFCLRVIRKGLRKNSEIFVNLRRSSGQSTRERIQGILGHYGMFRGIMGCSRGVPVLFRAVPGCSGCVLGMFRGVPGCSGTVPGCSRAFPGFTDTHFQAAFLSSRS